jgi:hypothetical protein
MVLVLALLTIRDDAQCKLHDTRYFAPGGATRSLETADDSGG